VELQKKLEDSGIRSSILKGQGIASYYGELASLRQPGDIDIYVDCERKKALQFAKSVGSKDVEWDYKHLHLDVFPDTEVEVHYRVEVLLNLRKNRKLQKWFKGIEDDIFGQEVNLSRIRESENLCIPTVEFNLFYILLHIYRHFLYEGVGVRQLMDYYFVLKANTNNPNDTNGSLRSKLHENHNENLSSSTDYTDLTDLLKQFGMWKFARGLMWVMQRVFGLEKEYMICEPQEDEGRFILSEVMEGGNFGHYDERLSSDQGGKLQTMKKVVKHNVHLMRHYPSEIIWPPVWFVWYKLWKLTR